MDTKHPAPVEATTVLLARRMIKTTPAEETVEKLIFPSVTEPILQTTTEP
jgi:hypothetical protein